jgi:hypothetical protein
MIPFCHLPETKGVVMMWLLCVGLAALIQAHDPASPSLDVSTLAVGTPTTVMELDLAKLKGDLRELAWSSDGTQFYVQTVEHKGKEDTLHHYLITASGGAIANQGAEPTWAAEYWRFKSDRYAPGLPSLVIDVKQGIENVKYGTGSAGAADRTSGGLVGQNEFGNSADNVARASQSQKQNVIRLVLLDETIGTWVDQRPTPGTTFSWGPSGSGAIAFVDEEGTVVLLDSQKHKQRIAATRDVYLPAWSTDGSRLAYLQKTGRNTYVLVWSPLTRRQPRRPPASA